VIEDAVGPLGRDCAGATSPVKLPVLAGIIELHIVDRPAAWRSSSAKWRIALKRKAIFFL
jgi:hypothetical protein